MNESLTALEERVIAITALVETLRAENQALRLSLAQEAQHRQILQDRIDQASLRIRSLLGEAEPELRP